ncbi:MAG TPA: alpha-glucan family phosphorylase [Phycisphaerae bacterium]|nr:alpha-glucan family phosphorylase [Phycisphaerae bacterium]
MYRLRTYTVVPALPERLARLRELAYNIWWSWNADAMELFRRLNPDLWEDMNQNPVKMLAHLAQRRLDQAAADKAYLAHMDRVLESFDAYMNGETWFGRSYADLRDARIAYFSMEFGLHESLPIYSGGLGILAGDHLKSASDLGLPLVGVGLLYRQGYFHQRLSSDGWQLEEYPSFDFYQAPITPVKKENGEFLTVALPIADRSVIANVWRVQVGRVPLFLLDADVKENDPRDREITFRLYGGDEETRIRQEVLLGIGGLRALSQIGMLPDVCHMNEGHAAFLALERIRQRTEKDGLSFAEAREAVNASLVFTTHTPVPAGIDRFEDELVTKYLSPFLPDAGLKPEEFLALGKIDASDAKEEFCMAVMALRLAGAANGVSALHGHVSREMWHRVWPGAPRDEVPITSITNGIHTNTWIAPEMADLLDRYLGPTWAENPVDHDVWRRVDEIPDLELWRMHERKRIALVAFARRRVKEQFRRRGAPPAEVKAADEYLDPEALTIGFARRFAPYKRGALLFRNPQRLLKILSSPERPVQLIFAGKAHPRDDNGKAVIKEIMSNITQPEFRRRILFIENYDMTVARALVQGADVWLNNPIKPREASGTSGMKVAPNGGVNLSVLDGWWPEAFDGENGWAIDEGRVYEDAAYRDHSEGEAIYDLLEKEIVPLFYDRGADGLPRGWLGRMKASMRTICPMFNTNRMIEEYANRLYVPAAQRWRRLSYDHYQRAKDLARWKHDVGAHWAKVKVEEVQSNSGDEMPVGSTVSVRARVHLGDVKPDDVAVELYHGRVDAHGHLVEGASEAMSCRDHIENGTYWFNGEVPCHRSGQHGYAVRIVPRHPDLTHRFDTGLILWS